MAASSSRSGEISPDRNVVWSEPQLKQKRVAVLYYLSRNGQLQHPHFMEVPLSSPRGLFLKDVIDRLTALRGKAMPSMYSWSSKRSYRNGFVWHDLSGNDLIYPAHGHDYILKGSHLPENDIPPPPPESQKATAERPRRNQPESSNKSADVHRRCSQPPDKTEQVIEVSTPPSDTSQGTLGTLMKADGQVRGRSGTTAAASGRHRRQKAQRCKSSVVMQLISCGSMPFKDCGAGGGQGVIGQHVMMAPRGGRTAESGRVKLEEKQYFSGSFVETKKREIPAVKRSSSYHADRSANLELAEKEIERLKAKCITSQKKGITCSISKT